MLCWELFIFEFYKFKFYTLGKEEMHEKLLPRTSVTKGSLERAVFLARAFH